MAVSSQAIFMDSIQHTTYFFCSHLLSLPRAAQGSSCSDSSLLFKHPTPSLNYPSVSNSTASIARQNWHLAFSRFYRNSPLSSDEILSLSPLFFHTHIVPHLVHIVFNLDNQNTENLKPVSVSFLERVMRTSK